MTLPNKKLIWAMTYYQAYLALSRIVSQQCRELVKQDTASMQHNRHWHLEIEGGEVMSNWSPSGKFRDICEPISHCSLIWRLGNWNWSCWLGPHQSCFYTDKSFRCCFCKVWKRASLWISPLWYEMPWYEMRMHFLLILVVHLPLYIIKGKLGC